MVQCFASFTNAALLDIDQRVESLELGEGVEGDEHATALRRWQSVELRRELTCGLIVEQLATLGQLFLNVGVRE